MSALQIHRNVFIDPNNQYLNTHPYSIWDGDKGDYLTEDRIVKRFESEKQALKYIRKSVIK